MNLMVDRIRRGGSFPLRNIIGMAFARFTRLLVVDGFFISSANDDGGFARAVVD